MHKEDKVPRKHQNKSEYDALAGRWTQIFRMGGKNSNGTYTMYNGILAIKKNEIVSFEEMWVNLETVIQSEIKSERGKQIY